MTRGTPLLAATIVAAIQPTVTSAQTFSGYLQCTVGRGSAMIIGAFRDLACDYRRDAQATESYAGYTGIVGIDADNGRPQVLAFQVFSVRPKSFGELEGRYNRSTFTISDKYGAPIETTVLRGGRDSEVVLRPISGSTALTIPNALLGLAQIQLDYRGERSADQRSQSED